MLDPAPIGFRPLELADLPQLLRWLNTPHVVQWWEEPPTFEEIVAKYTPRIMGQEPVHCFVILYDGHPIGYIQSYSIRDYPDFSRYVDSLEAMVGVDVFIGDADHVHKGLGSFIVTCFLRTIVFDSQHATSCLIDPDARNTVAIRAYEKAGFQHLQTVQVSKDNKAVRLMRVDKADLIEA